MKRTVTALFCGAALIAWSATISWGEVTSADKDMADRYLAAARNGDATAQFYLGALHSAGVGRSQSDTEAFRWFMQAAEQGHAQAILIVSGLHAIGRGTTKDNVSAYKWASIAVSGARIEETRNGARQLISVLEPRMSRDEIRQAKTEAERWRPAPTQTRQTPSNDVTRDRRSSDPAPATSSQPRQTTADDSTTPSRSAEPEKESTPSGRSVDDLLSRMPAGLRKRLGL